MIAQYKLVVNSKVQPKHQKAHKREQRTEQHSRASNTFQHDDVRCLLRAITAIAAITAPVTQPQSSAAPQKASPTSPVERTALSPRLRTLQARQHSEPWDCGHLRIDADGADEKPGQSNNGDFARAPLLETVKFDKSIGLEKVGSSQLAPKRGRRPTQIRSESSKQSIGAGVIVGRRSLSLINVMTKA
jgi:hypothetical protein